MKISPKLNVIMVFFSVFTSSITVYSHFFPTVSSVPPSFRPNTTAGVWNSFKKLSGCHFGQKVQGISNLKSYFHRLGYIQNKTTGNFTDTFDGTLQSAVKMYQRNFKLNVTGELDEFTVNQIMKPRCGVPDMVDGTNTMLDHSYGVLSVLVFQSRLDPGNYTYAFDPRNRLSNDVKRVFDNAFTRWSDLAAFTFTEVSNYSTANYQIGFYAGGDEFDGVFGILAQASGPFMRGYLHFDSDEIWITNNASGSPTAMDLESVVVHEIGHMLGLGHSSMENAIMFPTISPGVRKSELAHDDVEAILDLYDVNPYNDTFGAFINMGETSQIHRGSLVLVLIAMLFVLL